MNCINSVQVSQQGLEYHGSLCRDIAPNRLTHPSISEENILSVRDTVELPPRKEYFGWCPTWRLRRRQLETQVEVVFLIGEQMDMALCGSRDSSGLTGTDWAFMQGRGLKEVLWSLVFSRL